MTFAQFVGSGATGVVGVINVVVIPSIFALVFFAFVWGIVQYYFLHPSDETERARGRSFALWGILGMVLILSIWGIVNMVLSTLGIAPSR